MITIYTPQTSVRLNYVVDFIFKEVLSLNFQITNNSSQLSGVVINYSDEPIIAKNFQICPSKFLDASDLNYSKYLSFKDKDRPFFTSIKGDTSFDIFSAVFFLISRMEEYNLTSFDEHQRFISENSILVKLKLENKPIVDIWCLDLLEKLNHFFTVKISSPKVFSQYCTFDIDNAYAFKNKGIFRFTGSFLKDIMYFRVSKISQRVRVLLGLSNDPYDNYSYINSFLKKHNLKAIFFFLLGDYGKMDKNINAGNPSLINLIQWLNKIYNIGIHPSYQSFKNQLILKKEIQTLHAITSNKVKLSRFHYIRFSFPKSFQILNELSIEKDYSMGYTDRIGFRAGTCTPFYFYDLEKENSTKLKLVPYSYMDGVLKDQLKYTTQASIRAIKELKNSVKNVNGQFTTIWHNESLSNQDRWSGWRKVFEATWLD